MSWLRLRPHRKVPTNHPNAKILRLIHTREVGRLTSCLSSDSIGVMDSELTAGGANWDFST